MTSKAESSTPAGKSASSAAAQPMETADRGNRRRNSVEQLRSSSSVTLVSMDGDSFVVDASAILISKLLSAMVDESTDDGAPKEIPLPNMHSGVVAKVVEFCQHHKSEPMDNIPKPIQFGKTVSDHVQEWYSQFVESLGDEMLFELLLASNYLDLTPLLELCAATVGLRSMNKTPDEIRQEFNIVEAFSPEVEQTLRQENKWSTEPPIGS
ncbi:unnamed protein product [Scytosiphon promiscuus]